jgi:hypothetical protein
MAAVSQASIARSLGHSPPSVVLAYRLNLACLKVISFSKQGALVVAIDTLQAVCFLNNLCI